ncbi:MAG: L,D-transpeptidase family protein [Oligoflexia bacterium]|nr:L,D-transpeptidase family protein [Oligoflexia bacterium]
MPKALLKLFLMLICFTFSATSFAVIDELKGKSPAGLLRLGDGVLFPPYALVVDKSKKKIHVIDNTSGTPIALETYDSDLGKNAGDKLSQGDHKTPEGIYFLETKLEGSNLDAFKYGVRAFTTNYPNFFDQKLSKGGSGIWLHAIDDSVTLERGSRGCVVVRNDTIKKISQFITLRETPIMIFDKVTWLPSAVVKKESDMILKYLSAWKQSWESKDINSYIQYYADDFKFGKMSRNQFKKYKQGLAEKYQEIKVSLSMPVIYEHKDYMVVRFLQDYTSTDHADFGAKTLYLKKMNGRFLILNEEWREATDPNTKALLAGNNLCCQTHN